MPTIGDNSVRIIQLSGGAGSGSWSVVTALNGDKTYTDSISGTSFTVPLPLISRSLVDLDGNTSIKLESGLGVDGGDIIKFQVDGIDVGSVEVIGGITKWTLDGILDPIVYAGTPRTIAQRNALTPLAGYLVYISDGATKEYQYYDGTAWKTIGAGGITSISDWTATTTYVVGNIVTAEDRTYRRTISGTSAATFALDRANWEVIVPLQAISPWSDATYYYEGDTLNVNDRVFRCNTSHFSDAGTFNVDELTKWDRVENINPSEPYQGSFYYYQGEQITDNNKIYRRIAAGTSSLLFDVTEQANWGLVGGGVSTNIPNSPDSTLAPVSILDVAIGGDIGTAATTVDINSMFLVNQTTANQTLTLPIPTNTVGARLVTVQNATASTTSFIIYSQTLAAGESAEFIWNGASWSKVGADPTTQALSNVSLTMSNPNGSVSAVTTTIGSVYNVANLSAVALDVRYDPSGIVNTGNNSFTIQTAGTYEIIWGGIVNSTNPTTYLRKNGVRVGGILNIAVNNNASSFVYLAPLVAGDTLEIEIVATLGSMSVTLKQLPTAVAPVVNTVAEYGEQVLTSSINVPSASTNAGNATDVLSFILPSAGVWEVDYNVRATTPNMSASLVTGMVALITNNANVVQANSEIVVGRYANAGTAGAGSNLGLTGSGKITITTTGVETFKIRGHHDGSANGSQAFAIQSDNNGRTKVSWTKIAGQLPSTGTTVDYISLVGETGDSFTSAPSFILSSDANGTITAVAPTTARLPFTTQTSTGTMTVTSSGNMTVASNNVTVLATAVYSINASVLTARSSAQNYSLQLIKNGSTVLTTSNGISGTSVTRDTQSINWAGALSQGDTIDIRVKDGGTLSIGVARYSLLINQLGSSAITTNTRVNVICRNKTAQSIPANSWGNLTNWTEIQDPTSSFDPVTGVFTAPRTASYAFSTGNGFTVNTGNYVGQAVFLNNATQLYNFLIIAPTLAVSYIQTNGVIEMTAGQTLQARTFNGAGGAGNDSPSASNSWFTITEINPTF